MSERYRFGDLLLDTGTRELTRAGVPVPLQARVLECLACLIANRERAVGRDELVQAVFGRRDVSDAQLAQAVLRARRAVGDDGQAQRSIRTVPRFGFRWVAPVEVLEAVSAGPLPAAVADGPVTHRPVADGPVTDGLVADDTSAVDPPVGSAASVAPVDGPVAPGHAVLAPAARTTGQGWRHARIWRRASVGIGTRRVVAVAVLAAGVLAVAIGVAWRLRSPPAAADAVRPAGEVVASPRALAVLPLQVAGGADSQWARLGLMDDVAERLRRSGIPVPASEAVLAIVAAQGTAAAPDPLRDALRVGWLVSGDVRPADGGWVVDLRATHADGSARHARGRHAQLLAAARLAADRLAPALGGVAPATPAAATPLDERLQRARVAMLANELDAARRILQAAPELQREQPRLRYQLARVDFRAGAFERGLATLDGVLAEPGAIADPLFHARVRNARAAMLVRLDRTREARADYDRALQLLADGPWPTERGVALGGRGVSWAMEEAYPRAIADLSAARVAFDDAGDALAVARVDGNLGTLESGRGRPAYGMPFLGRAIDALAPMGAVNELATVLATRTSARLALLQYAAARADSDRGWALLARLEDPGQRAGVVLARAEVMLATGHLREAGRLLAMADAGQSFASDRGRLPWLQAELALATGAPREALQRVEQALAAWPPQRAPTQRAWLLVTRERAALAAGQRESATPDAVAGDLLPSRLAMALRLQGGDDPAATDAAYASALALAERDGVPGEIAAVARPYTRWLLDQARPAAAAAMLGRLGPWVAADFELALLQARAAAAMGQSARYGAALAAARALAGERELRGLPAAE